MAASTPAPDGAILHAGAAYVDGRFMPVGEAAIPLIDWGYRRSDVTYDVVSVWDGAFFRLDDHLRRFRTSIATFRLHLPESDEALRGILHELVRLTGLREAYVAMDCLRGHPQAGAPYHPAGTRCYLAAYAVPYVWLMPREVINRGVHLIIAATPRVPEVCVDPRAKNFQRADMTRAQFEAHDAGADNPILLDLDGNVTEGPGFNIFAVSGGVVVTPDRGVLEGITRLSVIELCDRLGLPCQVRRLPAAELRDADEVFISSTAGGVMGVTRLDSRILGNGRPGPLTEQLHDAYWRLRKQGWHADPVGYGRAAAE